MRAVLLVLCDSCCIFASVSSAASDSNGVVDPVADLSRLGELEIMAAEASALQQLWPG